MNSDKFQELLARARAKMEANKIAEQEAAAETLDQMAATCQSVDLSQMGIPDAALRTDTGQEAAVEAIRSVIENIAAKPEIKSQEDKRPAVSRDITLNAKQQLLYETVLQRRDVILIGAAGTGKTTCMRKVTRGLIDGEVLPSIKDATKYLVPDTPGAVIVSYTRKAVNNIRHAVVDELKSHVLTIHKLLEFAPVFYEIEDPNTGLWRKTMRFEPTRNFANPLPPELQLVIFEESSMIGTDLYALLQDALPHPHQEVFLGDLQQLPPIFGPAILGFKLLELPVVELTEVYRQAKQSPIIELAWALLSGDKKLFDPKTVKTRVFNQHLGKEVDRISVPSLEAFSKKGQDDDGNFTGEVIIQPWQKKLGDELALNTAIKQFNAWSDGGYYDANSDIILCPFNKAFGTIELNKGIAQHLGTRRGATVYEVIAGFNKHYLAVGDRVLFDKEDAFITGIVRNGEYLGKRPQPESPHLDRWGHYRETLSDEEISAAQLADDEMDLEAIEKFMAAAAGENEDRVNAASHVISIRYAWQDDDAADITLSTAAEINALLGGYALTVHKFQGSQARKVFFITHHSHAVMNCRELLYTAVTRPEKSLHVICEVDTFYRGVQSQRIKGNTIQEKAKFFMGKARDGETYKTEKAGGDVARADLQTVLQQIAAKDQERKDAEMRFSVINATGRNETVILEPGEVPQPATCYVQQAAKQEPVVPNDPIEAARAKLAALRAAQKMKGKL